MKPVKMLSHIAATLTVAAMTFPALSQGGTWGPLMHFNSGTWPASALAMHMAHLPPATPEGKGRIVTIGYYETYVDGGVTHKGTQAYVWDIGTEQFINHMGQPSLAPDRSMFSEDVDLFCGSH